jgi:hypothetical protein
MAGMKSFWNVVTGRTLNWNKMREEANARVLAALRKFAPARSGKYPEHALQQCRNLRYAFYSAAEIYFVNYAEKELPDNVERLYSLNASSYLCLICAFETSMSTLLFLSKPERIDGEPWYLLDLESIRDTYDRPASYAQDWYDKRGWIMEADNWKARLGFRLYDEIAPILGLETNTINATLQSIVWFTTAHSCLEVAAEMYASPRWNEEVEFSLRA